MSTDNTITLDLTSFDLGFDLGIKRNVLSEDAVVAVSGEYNEITHGDKRSFEQGVIDARLWILGE